MNSIPISVLLIEDNLVEQNKFTVYLENRTDIKIISYTHSIIDAINLYQLHKHQAIILDIELNGNGSTGTGITFLQELKNLKLKIKPIIIVTTNILSELVYNCLHILGADLIFYKKSHYYSPKIVIENILALYSIVNDAIVYVNNNLNTTSFSPNCISKLSNKINIELDTIGISPRLVGRKYIYDALIYLLQEENNTETVYTYLSKKYKIGISGICRSIQTAIYRAWRTSPIEYLEEHYTAKYNHENGVPLPTEFLFYYVEKIKNKF